MDSSYETSTNNDTFIQSDLITVSESSDYLELFSESRTHISDFTVNVTTTLYQYEENYDSLDIPVTYTFSLQIPDPCSDSVIEPTETSIDINYVLGFEVSELLTTYSFLNFPDTKSVEWFGRNEELYPEEGYSFCGLRTYRFSNTYLSE